MDTATSADNAPLAAGIPSVRRNGQVSACEVVSFVCPAVAWSITMRLTGSAIVSSRQIALRPCLSYLWEMRQAKQAGTMHLPSRSVSQQTFSYRIRSQRPDITSA